MHQSTSKNVDRDELYDEVWTDPMTIVAPRYGLSDVGLAKICRSLAIPIPSRGYWAKVKAGKVMRRAPLPKLRDHGPVSTGLVKLPTEEAESRSAAKTKAASVRRQLAEHELPSEIAAASNPETSLHPLVAAASKRLRKRDGWPKGELVRSAPKEVLNIQVSAHALDRALDLANRLLNALGANGVRAAINTEKGVTFLDVDSPPAQMEFSITEQIKSSPHELTRSEKQARDRYFNRWRTGYDRNAEYPTIPSHDYTATGKLTVSAGSWPRRNWNDTAKAPLEQRIGTIVGAILVLGHEIHAKNVEQARREEAYRQAKEQYDFLTARREKESADFERLEKDATSLERAKRLRAFADEVQHRATLEGRPTSEIQAWLDWVRAKADWLDPLILVSDSILDAPEPRQPSYW